jgi:Na+-transporting methylmalonyl-CoA/oxaloacetate decarboxylase gamma subunit
MTPFEALTVTLLGISIVFVGLVLCILFINGFNRVARHVKWGEEGHGHGAAPPPKPAAPSPAPTVVQAAPVVAPTPEVLAAIVATLEMEHRLYGSHTTQRLTIRRSQLH